MDGLLVLMRRRDALALIGWGTGAGFAASLIISCDSGTGPASPSDDVDAGVDGAAPPVATDASTADACTPTHLVLHDTSAQALYLDGSYGPLTGTIRVAQIAAGTAITLDFWHGHGGQLHRFTLTPANFADLRAGKKVTVGTTMVDGHAHTLFIDPSNESYRAGPDVPIDLPC